MKLTRATQDEKDIYSHTHHGSLYGYLHVESHTLPIENLPNDPHYRYEVFAPDGTLFDGDLTSMLGSSLADIKARVQESTIETIEESASEYMECIEYKGEW